MSTKNQILDYERRLLILRMEWNEILKQLETSEMTSDMKIKVDHLQKETEYLNKELFVLKQSLGMDMTMQNIAPNQMPQNMAKNMQPSMEHIVPNQMPQNMAKNMQPSMEHIAPNQMPQNVEKNIQPSMEQKVPNQMPQGDKVRPHVAAPGANSQAVRTQKKLTPKPKKEQKDLEKAIGKSWMAIFASLLIFISIVMFATLLIPNLSDVAKVCIMYIFSISVTALGTVNTIKHSNNKLWISIAGCGVGALFISLLLTNMYFHMIGAIPLFILILLWSVGVCYLSRYQTLVFQIIGQMGIMISVCLGIANSVSDDLAVQMILVVCFYVITQVLFFLLHRKKECYKNTVSHVCVMLNAVQLMIGASMMQSVLSLYIVFAFVAVYFVMCLMLTDNEKDESLCLGIVYAASAVLLAVANILIDVINNQAAEPRYFLICYPIFLLFLILAEWKKVGKMNRYWIEISTLIIIPLLARGYSQSFWAYEVIALLCFVGTILCKRCTYHYAGMLWSGVFLISAFSRENMLIPVILAVLINLAFEIFLCIKTEYWGTKSIAVSTFYLLIMYIFSKGTWLESAGDVFVIDFVCICVCNMLLLKIPYTQIFKEGKDGKFFNQYLQVINSILVVMALPAILCGSSYFLFAILVSLALYSINVKKLLDHKMFILNLYVGVKYTILLLAILKAFEASGIIVSISCLVLSIVSIMAGFGISKKALRIYGLILANLCVIKLILIDMEYQNLTQRAIGFFICGILCFVISFIYNRIEHRAGNEKNAKGQEKNSAENIVEKNL